MNDVIAPERPVQVWWHIMSNDGKYLSRSRFGTKESAIQEMLDAPKTYSPKLHVAVRVEYRLTETASAGSTPAQEKEKPAES